MDIKPIETYYNGYRFRSRLEARWAVFFDAMRIKYEYEPEGFEFGKGEKYLPDFFLPDFCMYVEIKNVSAFTFSFKCDYVYVNDGTENGDKYLHFANEITKKGNTYLVAFGDPIDAFMDKKHGGKGDNMLFYREECAVHTIVAMAAKSKPNKEFISDHGDCKRCTKFLQDMGACKTLMLTQDNVFICYTSSGGRRTVPYVKKFIQLTPPRERDDEWSEYYNECDAFAGYYVLDFRHAAKQARQARFEHDETPIIKRQEDIYYGN